ncbi:MAG: class II aldolase/adducin family protein [Synergistaceae bacterium]|jgi:L-fuculose-phosphate aldolase|nr:class II aldolase/adducin family protein [Synergistaceae bacterium]
MYEELRAVQAGQQELLRVARLAEQSGLCRHGSGNFSLRVRRHDEEGDGSLFVVTPHAESRFSITPDDVIVANLDGTVVENRGGLQPTSELALHCAVLNARRDVNAVCHTHAPNATAFAVLNRPIPPCVAQAAFYGWECGTSSYYPPGTPELAASVVRGLGRLYVVLMERHGLLTVGESIYDAYMKTVYAEEVAEINVKLSQLGGGLDPA